MKVKKIERLGEERGCWMIQEVSEACARAARGHKTESPTLGTDSSFVHSSLSPYLLA